MKKKSLILLLCAILSCSLLGFGAVYASEENNYPLPVLEETTVYYEDFDGFETNTLLTTSNYNQFAAKNEATLQVVDNATESSVPASYGNALKITTTKDITDTSSSATLLETSNMFMKLEPGYRYYVTLNIKTENVNYFQIVVLSGIAPNNPALGFIGGGALDASAYRDVSVWEGFPRLRIDTNTADSETGFERITFSFEVREGENPFLSFNFREGTANTAKILLSEFSIEKSGVSYAEDFESYTSQEEYFKYATPSFNPYYKLPPFIAADGVTAGLDRGDTSFAIGAESASLYFTGLGTDSQHLLATFGASEQFAADGSKTGTTVDRQLFALGKKNIVEFEFFLFGGRSLTAEVMQGSNSLGKMEINAEAGKYTAIGVTPIVAEKGTKLAYAEQEFYAIRVALSFDAAATGEVTLKIFSDTDTWGKVMIDNLRISNVEPSAAPEYRVVTQAEIDGNYSGMDYLSVAPLLDKLADCYSTVAAEGNSLAEYRANGTSLFINFIDSEAKPISSDGYTFARIADKYMIYPGSYRLSLDVRSSDVGALRFLLVERGEGEVVNIGHAYFNPQNFAVIADATPSFITNHSKNADGSSHIEIYFATDKAAYMDISAKLLTPQTEGAAPWLSMGNLQIAYCGDAHAVVIPEEIANGTVTADKQSAVAGETVTLTVTPSEGYRVASIKVNDAEIRAEDGKYTFTMPFGDANVTAQFEAVIYDITVETSAHGSVTADKQSAAVGEKVTLTVTPEQGYRLAGLKANGTDIQAQDGIYTFTMPAAEVNISAEFEAILYDITIAETANGTVVADKQSAGAGDSITLTVTPEQGYMLVSLKVNGTDIQEQDGKYMFTMPAGAAEITAEFGLVSYKVTLPQGDGYTVTALSELNVPLGGEFRFKVTIAEGYDGSQITVKAGTQTLTADSEGVYTVKGIDADTVISVSGVEENKKGGCASAVGGTGSLLCMVCGVAAFGAVLAVKRKNKNI